MSSTLSACSNYFSRTSGPERKYVYVYKNLTKSNRVGGIGIEYQMRVYIKFSVGHRSIGKFNFFLRNSLLPSAELLVCRSS